MGTQCKNSVIYILMNKPSGYVCSSVSDSHKTVYELLPQELQDLLKAKRGARLHTVGRLDCDTTGLLLLTTDGYFSDRITRQENNIEKCYQVELKNKVSEEEKIKISKLFLQGLTLPAQKKAPEQNISDAQVTFTGDRQALVTIKQGLFHQVKRMFLAVGNEVLSLKRKSIGPLMLPEDLQEGQWRYLSDSETESLKLN